MLEAFPGRAGIADLSGPGDLEPVRGENLDRVLRDVRQPGDRLLGTGIPENLRSLDRTGGPVVQLMARPIRIAGVEAAPVRAVGFDGWSLPPPSRGDSARRPARPPA
ncbi:hypothetical protein [Micromonospora sp. HUAS LYJ1]|uniref:hypothetical protein n=1 Tax=Micromonospora sp. HUAS LYJ1 TaxID=3061626 RepID=UPI0026731175|nr:hypothetical protein [Micromonospora sp. HUAS LYJ1]WKU07119.1 hypothetical protein Q2K16_08735 [Micromonospora sp. HUAS LYJ1]